MRTSTLRASKAHVSLWKFFAALLLAWICVPMSQASAQEKPEETTTLTGVDDLTGIDPSSAYCTTEKIPTDETDANKIVYLYNVGAKKFLCTGGMWGTHASLDATPYPIYMVWNSGSSTFFLENKVEGSAKHPYLGIGSNGQVHMDTYDGENSAIKFKKPRTIQKLTRYISSSSAILAQ